MALLHAMGVKWIPACLESSLPPPTMTGPVAEPVARKQIHGDRSPFVRFGVPPCGHRFTGPPPSTGGGGAPEVGRRQMVWTQALGIHAVTGSQRPHYREPCPAYAGSFHSRGKVSQSETGHGGGIFTAASLQMLLNQVKDGGLGSSDLRSSWSVSWLDEKTGQRCGEFHPRRDQLNGTVPSKHVPLKRCGCFACLPSAVSFHDSSVLSPETHENINFCLSQQPTTLPPPFSSPLQSFNFAFIKDSYPARPWHWCCIEGLFISSGGNIAPVTNWPPRTRGGCVRIMKPFSKWLNVPASFAAPFTTI